MNKRFFRNIIFYCLFAPKWMYLLKHIFYNKYRLQWRVPTCRLYPYNILRIYIWFPLLIVWPIFIYWNRVVSLGVSKCIFCTNLYRCTFNLNGNTILTRPTRKTSRKSVTLTNTLMNKSNNVIYIYISLDHHLAYTLKGKIISFLQKLFQKFQNHKYLTNH